MVYKNRRGPGLRPVIYISQSINSMFAIILITMSEDRSNPPTLQDIVDEERVNLKDLKRRFSSACTLIPENMDEYDLMRRTYDSVGLDTVNDFRVMLGYLTNPTSPKDERERYIAEIPLLLDCLEEDGKDVQYLRVAYDAALEHCNSHIRKGDK